MRVVSYNILDGGAGRADALAGVIKAQRPDVVCLAEADDVSVVEAIAGRLGMDFIHAPGNSHASALLSRWPVVETINHAPLHPDVLEKSLLEATVADPSSGTEWGFGVVHLHARAYEADEDLRLRELSVVLSAFAPYRNAGRPHVLCGDFNANAPHQRIDPGRCKPKTREAWENNGGRLPRRAVGGILAAGYLDTLHAFDPAAGETACTFSTEFPGQRVDYVFTSGVDPSRIRDAWVHQGAAAKAASDHFPVGVEVV